MSDYIARLKAAAHKAVEAWPCHDDSMASAGPAVLKLIADYDALAAQRDEGLAREAELQHKLERHEASAQTLNEVLLRLRGERNSLQQRLAEAEQDAREGSILLSAVVEWVEDGFGGSRRRDKLLHKSRQWLNDSNERTASPGCADGEKAK